jgi:hypothetical protein
MVMPAPGLFSTTKLCPTRGPSLLPIMRAITSVLPPGAAASMILTGRVGHAAWACAATGSPSEASAAVAARRLNKAGEHLVDVMAMAPLMLTEKGKADPPASCEGARSPAGTWRSRR